MGKKITSYKGFDKDLKCRGFQYEIGQSYKEEEAKACDRGFHACQQPIEVFGYYPPGTSRYCQVEQSGKIDEGNDDSKIASSEIKIGAEIGIPGIVKAQVEYVKAHTTTKHTDPKMATAGNRGAATSRGSSATGENGLSVARGNNVKVKGGLGAVLVIAEENSDDYDVKEWKAAVVDGETIKADTWYCLKDGEFEEVQEDGRD